MNKIQMKEGVGLIQRPFMKFCCIKLQILYFVQQKNQHWNCGYREWEILIMNIKLRECTIDDLSELYEISCKTFKDTFESGTTEADMIAYLKQAYNIEKLRGELSNSNSTFYFVYRDEYLSGYLKLNEFKAQSDINDSQAMEIERIYMTKEAQGKGLGSILMNKAIEIANKKGKSYIWLGVWENNIKALAFYKKNGFYKIGEHSFVIGDDQQTDYLMRKDLILV